MTRLERSRSAGERRKEQKEPASGTDWKASAGCREAWIALGSNLGPREDHLRRSVELMAEAGIEPVQVSNLYETRPEGGAPEPPYLNAVLRARTLLEPVDLLERLHRVESRLGRSGRDRRGPRTCDLDLLSLGNLIVEERPGPLLPHPRLHRRAFVLVPLCELNVHWCHPALGETAGDLLAALPRIPGEVVFHAPFDLSGREAPALHAAVSPPAGG